MSQKHSATALAALAAGWWPGFAPDAPLTPLGDGHINDTWGVSRGGQRYVLQRINRRVFSDPEQVMENICRVLAHATLPRPDNLTDHNLPFAELVPTRSGGSFVWQDQECFRLWSHVDAQTLSVASPQQAFAAGQVFARMQCLLDNLPGDRLRSTIPDFLNFAQYLDRFDALPTADPELTKSLSRYRFLAERFHTPNRHIHGDCKIDNLLFRGDTVAAVLDLDTMMYGHWAWDFGDLVRSACLNRQTGGVSVETFESVLQGFVAGGAARDATAEDVSLAPQYVTAMLGCRFLTDHEQGDVYFKVAHRGENLQRAAVQFALADSLSAHQPALMKIAGEVLREAT